MVVVGVDSGGGYGVVHILPLVAVLRLWGLAGKTCCCRVCGACIWCVRVIVAVVGVGVDNGGRGAGVVQVWPRRAVLRLWGLAGK